MDGCGNSQHEGGEALSTGEVGIPEPTLGPFPSLTPDTGDTESCQEETTLDMDLQGQPGPDPTAAVLESTVVDLSGATLSSSLDSSPLEACRSSGIWRTGVVVPPTEGPGSSLSLLHLCPAGLACLAVAVWLLFTPPTGGRGPGAPTCSCALLILPGSGVRGPTGRDPHG